MYTSNYFNPGHMIDDHGCTDIGIEAKIYNKDLSFSLHATSYPAYLSLSSQLPPSYY